jgi:death-on-curing protein
MTEPVWVAESVVRSMHGLLLAEHGGTPGVRDEGLLDSALARPQQLLAYAEPNLFELATAYASGIIRNHPFIDGNKRTGFMTAFVFLARNGEQLIASEVEATHMVTALAAGELTEDEFTNWLRDNCQTGS